MILNIQFPKKTLYNLPWPAENLADVKNDFDLKTMSRPVLFIIIYGLYTLNLNAPPELGISLLNIMMINVKHLQINKNEEFN